VWAGGAWAATQARWPPTPSTIATNNPKELAIANGSNPGPVAVSYMISSDD